MTCLDLFFLPLPKCHGDHYKQKYDLGINNASHDADSLASRWPKFSQW